MKNSISLDNGSNNSIVVDGTIGSDWTDGNYTLTKGYFEGNTGITELYTTITPGGLFVGLNTTQTYESGGTSLLMSMLLQVQLMHLIVVNTQVQSISHLALHLISLWLH